MILTTKQNNTTKAPWFYYLGAYIIKVINMLEIILVLIATFFVVFILRPFAFLIAVSGVLLGTAISKLIEKFGKK